MKKKEVKNSVLERLWQKEISGKEEKPQTVLKATLTSKELPG